MSLRSADGVAFSGSPMPTSRDPTKCDQHRLPTSPLSLHRHHKQAVRGAAVHAQAQQPIRQIAVAALVTCAHKASAGHMVCNTARAR